MGSDLFLRKPRKEDAKSIFTLVKNSKVLDVNSEYLYLLQCTHFKESCCVATVKDEVVGFISGYILPQDPKSLFIWQVVVDEKMRGQNVANKILKAILSFDNMKEINYIHTTVSPSNKPSQRVFEKLAESFNTTFKNSTMFAKEDFIHGHEDEVLYEIGPLQ